MSILRGLPQGSLLSPLLYNLYTSGVGQVIRELEVKILQYADDIAVYLEYVDREGGVRRLEEALERLREYLAELDLEIAPEKTQILTFSGRKGSISSLGSRICLGDIDVEEVGQARFLGVVFDRNLLFREHAKYVVERVRKRMNILKCIGGVNKGADPETALRVFKAIIRSVIEYGSIVYWNRNRFTDRLQKIHNAGIRVALGYRLSTPINVMEVEAGVMNLEVRLGMLAVLYMVRKGFIEDREVIQAIEGRIRNGKSGEARQEVDLVKEGWLASRTWLEVMERRGKGSKKGKWSEERIERWLDIDSGGNMLVEGFPEQALLGEIKKKIFGQSSSILEIYTDGSRIEGRENGGGGIVIRRGRDEWEEVGFTAHPSCSVFSIELQAIGRAVEIARERFRDRDVLILSDSLSAIRALGGEERGILEMGVIHEIRRGIKKRNFEASEEGEGRVGLAWIPAHVGITGNERANGVAKEYTVGEPEFWVKALWRDIKRVIVKEKWKESDERNLRQGEFKGRKYFRSKWNNVGKDFPWFRFLGNVKRDTITILNRIRSDHYNLNWSLFRKFMKDSPYCDICDDFEDIEHVLWSCNKYVDQRVRLVENLRRCNVPRGAQFFESSAMGEWRALRLIAGFLKKCNIVV
nr:PREDICTED: uncharacterized protein LOC105663804 [Megachile rotundata]